MSKQDIAYAYTYIRILDLDRPYLHRYRLHVVQ